MKYEILKYLTEKGKEPYSEWINSFKDKTIKARISKRILSIGDGNFGDHKYLSDGVYELRCHFGSGYRIYYGKDGDKIILLLCGGDKSTQVKDVIKAKEYWQDYLEDKNG